MTLVLVVVVRNIRSVAGNYIVSLRDSDENYAFRAYLKNHADIDVLDEQFLKL